MKPGEKQQAHKRLVIPIQVCADCLYWQKNEGIPDTTPTCPTCGPEHELIPTTANATVRYA